MHDTGTNVSAEPAAFHPKLGIYNQVRLLDLDHSTIQRGLNE